MAKSWGFMGPMIAHDPPRGGSWRHMAPRGAMMAVMGLHGGPHGTAMGGWASLPSGYRSAPRGHVRGPVDDSSCNALEGVTTTSKDGARHPFAERRRVAIRDVVTLDRYLERRSWPTPERPGIRVTPKSCGKNSEINNDYLEIGNASSRSPGLAGHGLWPLLEKCYRLHGICYCLRE